MTTEPRLAPAGPEGPRLAKLIREAQEKLGELILAAIRPLWPAGVDGQVTVVARRGKFKVQFGHAPVKEEGYQD